MTELRLSPSGEPLEGAPGDVLVCQGGSEWAPGAGGGGAVSSVFARTGAVVAVAGDYAATQVDNDSSVLGSTVADALDTLAGASAPVTSVFGRIGAVVAAVGDYAASQVNNDSGVAGTRVSNALNTLSTAIAALVTGVSSVYGRTGAVVAVVGDYAASQVNNDSGVAGTRVSNALNTLSTAIAALVTGVSSVYGRTGAVMAAVGDYAASQVNNDSGVAGARVSNALDTLNGNISQSLWWGGPTVGNSTANRFFIVVADLAPSATEADGQWVVSTTGLLKNFQVRLNAALATANVTYTIRLNGVSTALTCTMNAGATSASDTVNTVAVAAGARISCLIVASAADATTSRPRASIGFSVG